MKVFSRVSITAALVSTFALFSGCSVSLHLYPVAGPVAALTPPPSLPVRMTVDLRTHSGTLATTLADGEKFKGRRQSFTPGSDSANDLSATWDQVYGKGFYVARVLGNRQCLTATITGSRSTILSSQYCGADKAIAKDDHGNVYKLTADGIVQPNEAKMAGR